MAVEPDSNRPVPNTGLIWSVALCATVVVGWPFAVGVAFLHVDDMKLVPLHAIEWPDPRFVALALAITCMFWFTPIALLPRRKWAGVVRGFAFVMHASALLFALHFLYKSFRDLASGFVDSGVTPAQALHGLYVIGVLSTLVYLLRCLLAAQARFPVPSQQAGRATLLLIGSCLMVTLASAAFRSWGNGLAVPVVPFDRQSWLTARAPTHDAQQPLQALCPRGGMAANLVLERHLEGESRDKVEAQLGLPDEVERAGNTAVYRLGVCTRAMWPQTDLALRYRAGKLRSAMLRFHER